MILSVLLNGLRNLKYRAEGRRSLTRRMTLKAIKYKNTEQASLYAHLPPSQSQGRLGIAGISQLKGQTAKGFFHSTLVYILLPGSTAQ